MTRTSPPAARPERPGPDRDARLKAALKANIARRKAQAQKRAAVTESPADSAANTTPQEARPGES